MKRLLAIATVTLLATSFAASSASAKKNSRSHKASYGMMKGYSVPGGGHAARMDDRYTGGNAAMSGNNGNSGSGSNSLGHIKGGNSGSGSP